ncbi:membrane protein insertase YidC [Rhodobacteraceae bacterium WD3A24]|nr:membrane protein insertase YidC [Rhodobacteraceae bacterium WD3A24]
MDDQNRNLILATALSFLVILAWFVLFPPPEPAPEAPTETTEDAGGQGTTDTDVALTPPDAGAGAQPSTAQTQSPEAPTEDVARVAIESPRVTGSISLLGGRIDDLSLSDYAVELDSEEIVRLLAPVGADEPYYALYGWAPGGALEYADVPGANTVWQQVGDNTLSPGSPVNLRWESPAGLVFTREIAIDDDYMFTVTQRVENTGDGAVRLAPYGVIARHGRPDTVNFFILHEGLVQMSDGELTEDDYDALTEYPRSDAQRVPTATQEVSENGWIGFTDKYWMTTLVPEPGQSFDAVARHVPGADIYQAETRHPAVTVEPGATSESRTLLFAGAKEWETIRGYETELGIAGFLDSIDWGWFFFLTKPIFAVLHWVNTTLAAMGVPGSMGWAIIGLTLLIKAILLPLAYKSYVSMAKMKELQPEMEKIKERAGDDRQKLQQEMMRLYKEKKVNPAAGCLPILLQIPIFFSLYKVIFVTIELRHAPWIGWIRDLSAPDPSSLYNLFGLLPWAAPDPEGFLSVIFIGVLPILLGVSMFLQMRLNPSPPDKTQAMIFNWMPWVFMFVLGRFASGLVLYWIANNVITFSQQYAIMRMNGQSPDLLANIRDSLGLGRKGGKAK